MKNQIDFLNVGIILIIIGISFSIYFVYSSNIQKNQQEEQFRIFLSSLQNLVQTMKNSYGVSYIEINTPNNIIIYSNGSTLIINYKNINYTINFNQEIILLNNYGENVPFLIYPSNIFLLEYNGIAYISPSQQVIQNIINEQ